MKPSIMFDCMSYMHQLEHDVTGRENMAVRKHQGRNAISSECNTDMQDCGNYSLGAAAWLQSLIDQSKFTSET